jgi:thiol:disulfide interchange protein
MRSAAGLALAIAASLAVAPSLHAAPAPKMAIESLAQLPRPLPLPYDEAADASADVKAALAKARTTHRLLLVDLGGNWCPDCRLLAALMRQPELSRFVEAHYVVVPVDVGRQNRNLQVPAHWGVDVAAGVPSLLIVDAHGKLLNQGHTAALADARHMSPQALADWLAQWTS